MQTQGLSNVQVGAEFGVSREIVRLVLSRNRRYEMLAPLKAALADPRWKLETAIRDENG